MYATHSLLLPVFEPRTYVVSQLEVFLARQLIVHSFDQLQDLQGRKRWVVEGCQIVGARTKREDWRRRVPRRLAEKAKGFQNSGPRRHYKMINGVYCDRHGERLGQGSCRVSFPRQSRSADARPPIANAAGRLSEQLKDETQGLAMFTRSQPMEAIWIVNYYTFSYLYTLLLFS